MDQYGTAGPAGIEPACAGLQPAANPSQLETLMVGKQGLEPRLPGPKPGALTLTPHPDRAGRTWTAGLYALRACALTAAPQLVMSGPPESNRVSPESESGRLPSSSIPKRGPPRTRTAHLLLARQALLPDELAAHCRRDIAATAHSAGMTTCRISCSRYGRVNKQAHSPSGGAS